MIEHQVVSRRCGCGAVSPGSAPAFAAAPVQYGPRVRAAAVYLMHEQFLSVNRTADAMADLFGVELAVATPTGAVAACAKTVAPVGVVIADRIAGAGLAHFDETGFRVASACHRLHSACTADAVFYTVHRRRGREANRTSTTSHHRRSSARTLRAARQNLSRLQRRHPRHPQVQSRNSPSL